MNSAKYVDDLITVLKNQGVPLSDVAWEAAKACVGWPYVFGARGGETTKDGIVVRQFDCRGFTYWILLQVYGWKLMGGGCTSQWNNADNWKAKGRVADGIPANTLVCLFYSKDGGKVWEHTGLCYNGQTVECSKGVQYSKTVNKKWTHWGVPACVDSETVEPVEDTLPTLRRGSKGSYVTLLQTKLANHGYDLGKCGVDGDFGKATEAAVKKFQQDSGLTVDGIVGAKTWAALEEANTNLYTVAIPHLPKFKAEALIKDYAGASMIEERG